MASARRAPALPDQLMSGAERSFVTVGFSWTLAKGFLWRKRKRKEELTGGGGPERTGTGTASGDGRHHGTSSVWEGVKLEKLSFVSPRPSCPHCLSCPQSSSPVPAKPWWVRDELSAGGCSVLLPGSPSA